METSLTRLLFEGTREEGSIFIHAQNGTYFKVFADYDASQSVPLHCVQKFRHKKSLNLRWLNTVFLWSGGIY